MSARPEGAFCVAGAGACAPADDIWSKLPMAVSAAPMATPASTRDERRCGRRVDMFGASGSLFRLRHAGMGLLGLFHQVADLGDVLRRDGAEIVAPLGADVLRHCGDLLIGELVVERRHLASAEQDARDDELPDRQHRVAGELRPDPTAAEVAVAYEARTLLVDRSAIGFRIGRLRGAAGRNADEQE